MEKNKNHKNIIKRMIDFIKANNLKMMFLLILAYFWYLLAKGLNFQESFFSSSNLPLIIILAFFGWMIFKMLETIQSEEDLELTIKQMTKKKLEIELVLLQDKYQKLNLK